MNKFTTVALIGQFKDRLALRLAVTEEVLANRLVFYPNHDLTPEEVASLRNLDQAHTRTEVERGKTWQALAQLELADEVLVVNCPDEVGVIAVRFAKQLGKLIRYRHPEVRRLTEDAIARLDHGKAGYKVVVGPGVQP